MIAEKTAEQRAAAYRAYVAACEAEAARAERTVRIQPQTLAEVAAEYYAGVRS